MQSFLFWNLEEWVVKEVIPDHSHNFLPAFRSHFYQLKYKEEEEEESTVEMISIEKQALGPRPLLPYEASHTHLSFLQMGPAPPSQLPHTTLLCSSCEPE